jgi:uncharacterized protein YdaU (DUF1376 family)
MHYYKFNISDWALHTAHLSLEEEIVYFRLINHYYDSEKPIPLENLTITNMVSREFSTLVRRLRLTTCYDTVISILEEFFIQTDEGWKHKRCDDEISAFHAKAERNREVGKLGGRPKKNPEITQTVSKDNPDISLTTNYKLLTNNYNKEKKASPDAMCPDNVDLSVWQDYLKIRKAQKKPITDTAIKGLIREAEKANLTLGDVLKICCERSWIGFKADWIQNASKTAQLPLSSDKQIEEAYRVECGGDPAKARFNSYFEMKKFILDFRDKKA